jgi:hypothetical protein
MFKQSKKYPGIIHDLPYNLKAGGNNSGTFYKRLEEFTELVLERGNNHLKSFLDDYRAYCNDDSNMEDALLDFLIIGVLYNEYSGIEISFLNLKVSVLCFLFSLRKQHPVIKRYTDITRGKLASRWLGNKPRRKCGYTGNDFKNFILFLKGTCEFKEDLKRISRVQNFMSHQTENFSQQFMDNIVRFAEWFACTANEWLGSYTDKVDHFWANNSSLYHGKEDYFFCGRSEKEYHLNMVGAALMNRSLSNSFQKTTKKVLLLPTCMADSMDCKAVFKGKDLTCSHCSPNCRISQVTNNMKKEGIQTVLIQHSSKFSQWLKPWANQKDTGLIGVACILNLLMGGFEMKRLNIPSQCVFLDHCGCKKHWLSGIATDINTEQVRKVSGKQEVSC